VTVAAVILAATPESALFDADGVPAVRRLADVAWAGGATPIVVVSFDPDGAVGRVLAGAPVTLAEPAPVAGGSVAQIRRGIDVAGELIHETTAALVWPARLVWVGAETVTSLIEAHGLDPSVVLRPTYGGERGWPVLVPMARAAGLAGVTADRMPDDVVADLVASGVAALDLERDTPSADLPPYQGPPEPPGAHAHEWGAAIADQPEDRPVEGPAVAPYGSPEGSATR
jgi:CTP:molybdopterin cytidylyltransferase MocA